MVDDRFYGLATAHPTAEWIANQITQTCGWKQAPRYLIRDRDGAYGEVFIRRVRSMGIRDRPTSPRSPWQNAYAERLIGSIRRECLDHVAVFGERHLRHVLLSYMNYYNEMRTHLSLDKDAPLSRHGSEGGAYSSPSNPGRAASPIYSDLICDRRKRGPQARSPRRLISFALGCRIGNCHDQTPFSHEDLLRGGCPINCFHWPGSALSQWPIANHRLRPIPPFQVRLPDFSRRSMRGLSVSCQEWAN